MPCNGDTSVVIYSNYSYTIYDPGGEDEYPPECSSTLTITSADGRPFTLTGFYDFDDGNFLTIYQGSSTSYPIDRFVTRDGSLQVYCYSGSVTLKFYSDYFGMGDGFAFDICFPYIYNTSADSVNSNYASLVWAGGGSEQQLSIFKSLDASRTTNSFSLFDYAYTLPSSIIENGTEYTYHIYYNSIYDTADYCTSPPHKFRTPKVQDCNSCDHYRECIDYTAFNTSDRVTCFKGTMRWCDSAICVVDNGAESMESQHTKHTDTSARDPRTNNLLRPVPLGDTSSVRLGNWGTGARENDGYSCGESILYEIHVDTNDYNLLMLRYAVVFQVSAGVLDYNKPRFTIKLFDQNCKPIQPLCYYRDIMYNAADNSWNSFSTGASNNPYKWHDWQSMAINLADWHGKTVYLQLSTSDGSGACAAYAYFTLHCGRQQVDHFQQCGNNVANTFYAPEGYRYLWYNAADPDSILSTDISLSVTDSGLYHCRVMPTDCNAPECGYTINALATPRYPQADFDYIVSASDCRFHIRFINRSVVVGENGDTLWTNEDCETAYWDFGNGNSSTDYNCETEYLSADTFNVTLVVGIAGNQCTDTITKQIVLEWAYATPYIDGENPICAGGNTTLYVYNNASEAYWTFQGHERTSDNLPIRRLQHSDTAYCHVTDFNQCTYDLVYPIRVLPAYNIHLRQSLCSNNLPFTWRDTTFYEETESGSYTFHRTSHNNCDSIVTLELTINTAYTYYRTLMFCDYDTVYRYGNNDTTYATYHELGQHTYTHSVSNGCDSIIRLTLSEYTVSRDTIWAQTCQGSAYHTPGFYIQSSQTMTPGRLMRTIRVPSLTIPCDSIVTLVLDILPRRDTTIEEVIVENQLPYTFAGVDFSAGVTDTVIHLQNHWGCDSSINFTLHVLYNTGTTLYDTICENQLPYDWDGLIFLGSSSQVLTYTNSHGADSLVVHNLHVKPSYNNIHYDTTCMNQPLLFCGNAYSSTGIFTHNYTAVEGCDSIETLNLHANPTHNITVYDTSCSNNSYTFANNIITSNGQYFHTFQNSMGCDSNVTLNLKIYQPTYSSVYDTVRENELPHFFNSIAFYNNVNDTILTLTNSNGCDSVITYSLFIWRNKTVYIDSTICDNALPLVWNGKTFYGQGTQNSILTTATGADSNVTMTVYVNPTFDNHYNQTICEDETYVFTGNSYNTSGNYTHHLTSYNGCDSSVTLHLTVNAISYATVQQTIVENQLPYTFNGFTYTTSDFQFFGLRDTITIVNAKGCDSVIDYTLHYWPNVFNTVDSTICDDRLPFTWNGMTFTASGTKTATLSAWTTADSSLTMNLHVNPTYSLAYYDTICSNEQTTFNATNYSIADTYSHLLQSREGCDSLETLYLTVLSTTSENITETIIENQLPYVFNERVFDQSLFNASSYITPRYSSIDSTFIIVNRNGCDSTIHYTLNVHWNVTATADSTICQNSMPLRWNSRDFLISELTTEGYFLTKSDTLTAYTGADSMLTMNLTIDSNTHSTYLDTIVENDLPHTFNGAILTSSINDTTIIIANAKGCDSLINYSLFVWWNQRTYADSTLCVDALPLTWNGATFDSTDFNFSALTPQATKQATLTNNMGADSIVVMTVKVNHTYDHHFYATICEETTYLFAGVNYNTPGSHIHNLVSQFGCDSTATLHLTVNAITHSTIVDTLVENQLPYTFNGVTYTTSDFQVLGNPSHSCDTCSTLSDFQIFGLRDTITIVNAKGCDSVIDYTLHYWPNVFNSVDSTICDDRLPFTWNGITFSTADTNWTTLTAWTGADSILTMNLHVNPTYSIEYFDTICSNEQHLFNGTNYSIAGTYPHLLQSSRGCDSLETLHLTVLGTSAATISDTVVENSLPVTFNGRVFNNSLFTAETFVSSRFSSLDTTIVIQNRFGCDSTIHYSLNVHWNVTATADSTICQNLLPIQWNTCTFASNDYTPAGNSGQRIYTIAKLDTLIAYTGADSVLTMNLSVDSNTHRTFLDTIVENSLPYTFNGTTYPTSIIEGAAAPAYNTSSIITIANSRGCDSIINHCLTIHLNKTTDLDSTICENSLPLIWQGVQFDRTDYDFENGLFIHTDTVIYTAHHGQDSIVAMHVKVDVNTISALFDTIVENQLTYTWNGVNFRTADTATLGYADLRSYHLTDSTILVNNKGCDSLTTMNLFVWRNRTASADSSLCENFFPLVWNDSIFPRGDISNHFFQKTALLSTTHGADSTLTMNVSMMHNTYSSWADTIVENQLPFVFNGYIFNATDFADTTSYNEDSTLLRQHFSYVDSIVIFPNTHGCDSIVNYRLNVKWNVHSISDSTICSERLPLLWNSRIFALDSSVVVDTVAHLRMITYTCDSSYYHPETGTFNLFDTMPAYSGADSIITLRLHLKPSYQPQYYDTVCESQTFVWYNDTMTVTGIYTMPFTSHLGCDSSEHLYFANYPNYDFTYYDTICDYSGVMRMGVEYIGHSQLNTVNECDSIETYHLWAFPVSYISIDTIISDHMLPYQYLGETYYDSTFRQQQFTLTNQYGCDSIIAFSLTVIPTIRETYDSTICDNMLPFDWDGSLFFADTANAGMPYTLILLDTFLIHHGADSIVTRQLHVKPTYDIAYFDTTCNGAPLPFADTTYGTTGIYTHFFTTVEGCDSIETLSLQVNALSYATVTETVVQNNMPHCFGGVTFTSLEGVTDTVITLLNTSACDSMITYTLHVLLNSSSRHDTTICDNELPMVWEGINFMASSPSQQEYIMIDSTVHLMPDGTDSITRYYVVVRPTYNITDTVRICDSYTWIDGITYTESIDVDGLHLSTALHCDSTKNLRLTIDHAAVTIDSVMSCDSFTWINGETYSDDTSGVQWQGETIHSCDSTVVLKLAIARSKATELFDTSCKGTPFHFGGNDYYTSGTYYDSLHTTLNCDSVVTMNLHVLMPPAIEIEYSYNCDTRIYTVTAQTDVPYYTWNSVPIDPRLDNQYDRLTIEVSPQTYVSYIFFADYKDVPTCPNDTSIELSPVLKPHAAIEYTPEFLSLYASTLSLINRSTNETEHRWWINDIDYGEDTRVSYMADIQNEDSVVVNLIASYTSPSWTCYDTANVVVPFRKSTIWAANAFTPNQTSNQRFYVRHTGITDYSIDIFTRGGVLVFHSEDMDEGWDGTANGRPCPEASYMWLIKYRDITAPELLKTMKGTVTLIR